MEFHNIHSTNDEIRLVSLAPNGLYLHKWNGFSFKYGNSKYFRGSHIKVYAKTTENWKTAFEDILEKDFGEFIQHMPWKDSDFSKIPAGYPPTLPFEGSNKKKN